MSKQTTDIAPLGIDRRFLERQNVPGLCKELSNLKPTGTLDKPYWTPEPNVDELRSTTNNPIIHDVATDLVHASWHVRNAVGKYTINSISLKRLVCFYADGAVRVYDPALNWQVTASKTFTHTNAKYQTTQINSLLAFSVEGDGEGDQLWVLVDDLFVELNPPELPVIHTSYELEDYYSQAQLDNGIYEGIRNGSIFVSYAYRMFDGSLLRQSMPFHLGLPKLLDGTNIATFKLKFLNEGFRQLPSVENISFWKDQISDIVILAGGYKPPFENGLSRNIEKQDLENILFHEVSSFPVIDTADKEYHDMIVEFSDKQENLSTYQLAEIPALSGRITGNVIYSYNSRLIIGGSSVDFDKPKITQGNRYFGSPLRVYAESLTLNIELLVGTFSGATVSASSNLSVITLGSTTGSVHNNLYTATIDAVPWSITINFGWYSVVITDTDYTGDSILPTVAYTQVGAGDNIMLLVDIETSEGVIQRLKEFTGVELFAGLDITTGTYSNFLLYGGTFTYPDRRAKRLAWWKHDGVVYQFQGSMELTASQTQNFSFKINSLPNSYENLALPDITVNDIVNKVDNRIYVSGNANPFSFIAAQTYTVGSSARDKITAFATNTFAISQGQFGQYPLYVFCEDSIHAIEQGRNSDIVFERISPVSLDKGVRSNDQVTNVGRSVLFVHGDNIYQMAGERADPIGDPIGNYPQSPHIDFDNVVLAARHRDGQYELVLSTGTTWLIYSLKFGRWYGTTRAIKGFFTNSGRLYCFGSDRRMYDESAILTTNVSVVVEFDPLHFLQPESLKRLYALYVRGSSRSHNLQLWFEGSTTTKSTVTMAMRINHRSVFSFRIRMEAVMDPNKDFIESFSAQIQGRYPQRTRISTPVT